MSAPFFKVEPRGLRTLLVHPDNDALLLDVGSIFQRGA